MTAVDQIRAAEQLLANRRRRDRVVAGHAEGFGEPAWELLLTLFVTGDLDEWVPVEQLIAGLPVTAGTARRYLRWLETQALVASDVAGARLAARGRELIRAYLLNLDAA